MYETVIERVTTVVPLSSQHNDLTRCRVNNCSLWRPDSCARELEQLAYGEPLETNAASKETTLSSGLKMIDNKEGQGDAVKTGNTVSVHYTGWLYENGMRGKKFDSSLDRGQPFVFTVGSGVIRGWSDGVVGMKPGGKRQLIIPPDLAYGPGGAGGGIIPPNATLDFEIELLQILR